MLAAMLSFDKAIAYHQETATKGPSKAHTAP